MDFIEIKKMNLYVGMVNKERQYVHAQSIEAAKHKLRRRAMRKFGRCDLTDIKEVEARRNNTRIIADAVLSGKAKFINDKEVVLIPPHN